MIGDSRTAADAGNTWPTTLAAALNTATSGTSTWRHDNVGQSATTAAWWAANIAAVLAAQPQNHVRVLVNIGVNDFDIATEAAWKADMLTVMDAVVAKWPAAHVYLTRPWKRNFNATADTYAAWIADLVAARMYMRSGPDERVTIKGADDGATNTTDGIHYSAAGQAAWFLAWQSELGY